MKNIGKKLFAVLLVLMILLQQIPDLHVHAGITCEDCGEWKEEYCQHCHKCLDCTMGWCDNCQICLVCAVNLDSSIHCWDCIEACFANEDISCCKECMRCADCCGEMVIDEWGGLCRECFEANPGDKCPECDDKIIRDQDGNETDDMGECGEHCKDCYEEHECPECLTCTLCEGTELCESCGMCEDCALELENHCSGCGDCLYEVAGCKDGGAHCENCCEENNWLCQNCGACTEALGKEICEMCGRCEDCQDGEYHCEECGECYENVNRCADGGSHCEDCCDYNEWICSQCGHCMEANGFDKCEFCGLCSECCTDNSYEMGDGKNCIADPKWKDEFEAKHAAGNHILVIEHDEDEHWYSCVYSGCTYEEGREEHAPNYNWKALEGGWGDKKGTEKCGCKKCGYDTVLTRETTGKTAYFEKSPVSVCIENGKTYNYEFKLVVIDSDGKKVTWNGGYVQAFLLPKGETWPEDPADAVNGNYAVWKREAQTSSGSTKGEIYGKRNGLPRMNEVQDCRLIFSNGLEGDDAYYVYSDDFKVTWAEHHIHAYNIKYGTWLTCPKPAVVKDYGLDPAGYCHWVECACGVWGNLRDCTPVVIGTTGNCQNAGKTEYMCSVCGRKWKENNTSPGPHVPTGILKDDEHRDQNKHYDICAVCGEKLASYDHNFELKHSYKTCTTDTRYYKCKDCGLARAEKVDLKTPNHDFTDPVYMDAVQHKRSCKKCGYILKEKHEYKTEYHGRCRCGADPNTSLDVTVTGTICPHGSAEVIFGSGVDPSMYEVGWGIGGHTYGPSTNWNFSENDAGAGYLIKIYVYTLNDEIVAPRTDGSNRSQVFEMPLVVFGYMDIPGYAADCVTDGVKAHKMCLGCGKMFDSNGNEISSVSIPKTGHTYDNDCDASCNVCGAMRDAHHDWGTEYQSDNQNHWHTCKKCGVNGQALSHHLTGATVVKPASCESPGTYKGKCSICGFEVTNTLPPTGHNLHYFERAATCISEGWKMHYGCESCRLCYTDDSCTTKISAKEYSIPIDPNNHVGGKMHHNKTHHWIVCKCGEKIEKEEHQFDDDLLCSVCGFQATKPDYSGLIKWIIIGALILLLLILLLILLLRNKKKKKEKEEQGIDPETAPDRGSEPSPGTEDTAPGGTDESAPEEACALPEGEADAGTADNTDVQELEQAEETPDVPDVAVLFGKEEEELPEGTVPEAAVEAPEENTDETASLPDPEIPEESEAPEEDRE